jgi:hypothetical protein
MRISLHSDRFSWFRQGYLRVVVATGASSDISECNAY